MWGTSVLEVVVVIGDGDGDGDGDGGWWLFVVDVVDSGCGGSDGG